jgi:hypothetical protein
MITQHLVVMGTPILCDSEQCSEMATVALRVRGATANYEMNFCDLCWLAMQRIYSPMVARDEQTAISEAVKIVGDDEQHERVKA